MWFYNGLTFKKSIDYHHFVMTVIKFSEYVLSQLQGLRSQRQLRRYPSSICSMLAHMLKLCTKTSKSSKFKDCLRQQLRLRRTTTKITKRKFGSTRIRTSPRTIFIFWVPSVIAVGFIATRNTEPP